jgi:hypothetical protein
MELVKYYPWASRDAPLSRKLDYHNSNIARYGVTFRTLFVLW